MNQDQQKTGNCCGQKQGCCCGSSVCVCGTVEGVLLIALGLFIAIPSIGSYFGLAQSNLFTQYSHIFLGA